MATLVQIRPLFFNPLVVQRNIAEIRVAANNNNKFLILISNFSKCYMFPSCGELSGAEIAVTVKLKIRVEFFKIY